VSEFDVTGVGLNATDTLILLPRFPAYAGKIAFDEEILSPGGQVASALITCATLGLRVKYIGTVGDDERGRVLDDLGRLVSASGRAIVSVPIEIGPALAGKQFVRALAAWRGQGDYHLREAYTVSELALAVFARRPVARVEYDVPIPSSPVRYGHKGFDWRIVQREIADRFVIERRMFSPLSVLGATLNSQAWFVCRR